TLSGGGQINSGTITDSPGGNVSIETGRVMVSGGAEILATSGFRDPATGTVVAGRGAAGNVTVVATESVSLSGPNSGLASNTFGSGNGGSIAISTPVLKLEDRARIEARTAGDGNAGDIRIEGNQQIQEKQLSVTGGAQINSSSGFFDSTTGLLFAGKGRGGNVTVTAADSISLTGQTSGLFSSTLGSGNAGMISISAPTVALTDGAQI